VKILLHSNAPWAGSGYGGQTALFAERFARAGHDVAISTNWGLQGQGLNWGDTKVYPGDNAWGNRTLPIIAAHHAGGQASACQVITLLDVHVMKQARLADLQLAAWVPVDHQPCPKRVHDFFLRTQATPIAMSRFGEDALTKVGLKPHYVPHGVDCTVFQDTGARAEARDKMQLPPDAFVVGMVARNQGGADSWCRKAFPQVFAAFAAFHQRHNDAMLYLHTDMFGFEQGINLFAMATAYGIPPDAYSWTHQGDHELGLVAPDELARMYSAFDVLANPSLGEGFGIPIVEAQACGTPVIVTDHTAMPELCGSGWIVGGQRVYDATQGAFWRVPSEAEILDAMEQAYDKAAGMRERARAFAVAYDADLVMADYWVPVLAALEGKLARGREVQPFDLAGARHQQSNGAATQHTVVPEGPVAAPNRAQRRAAARKAQV
jgi:glycosyltransferase involved in cell wall biosynthesis